jgi:FkbM family methyltransferase
LNRIDNAIASNIALSTIDTILEIDELDYHKAWNIGAFSLMPERDPQERSNKKFSCQFSMLDSLKLDNPVTLIKLDVEGMELEVLEGGQRLLSENNYPPILFESHDDERKNRLFEFLNKLGYSIIKYADMDFLAQHPNWHSEIDLIINETGYSYRRLR